MSKKGCEKAKTLSQNGCVKEKHCLIMGEQREKLGLSSWSICLSKILYSTPQISESFPFLFPLRMSLLVTPSKVIRGSNGVSRLLLFVQYVIYLS